MEGTQGAQKRERKKQRTINKYDLITETINNYIVITGKISRVVVVWLFNQNNFITK